MIKNPFMIYFLLIFIFIIKFISYNILLHIYTTSLQVMPSLELPTIPTSEKPAIPDYMVDETLNIDDISSDSSFLALAISEYANFDQKIETERFTAEPIIYTELQDKPLIPQPQFKVEAPMPKTVVLEKDVLDKHLPFTTPVNITVVKEDISTAQLIASASQINSLHVDTLKTIFVPVKQGLRLFTEDQISQMSLTIQTLLQDKLYYSHPLTESELITVIRDEIHDYLLQINFFGTLILDDLHNPQHFLNLLLHELTYNYQQFNEQEQAIIRHICGSLIVESICHVQHLHTSVYYYNIFAYQQLIDSILVPFIPK